jgi:hypothetical protein
LFNLSLICLEVTNLPSFPKNGESLIVNNILIVGSSIEIAVPLLQDFQISAIVSPISKPSTPTIAQISPANFFYFFCPFLQKTIIL